MIKLPTTLKFGDVILIRAVDLTETFTGSWMEVEDVLVEEPAEVQIAGQYLNHNSEVIRLGFGIITHDSSIAYSFVVPIGAIRSLEVLKCQQQ